jgi:hypothetical protein
LGSGDVALILDVPQLVRRSVISQPKSAASASRAPEGQTA